MSHEHARQDILRAVLTVMICGLARTITIIHAVIYSSPLYNEERGWGGGGWGWGVVFRFAVLAEVQRKKGGKHLIFFFLFLFYRIYETIIAVRHTIAPIRHYLQSAFK